MLDKQYANIEKVAKELCVRASKCSDKDQAIELYKQANLRYSLITENGYTPAWSALLAIAEEGNRSAINILADFYYFGNGVAKDKTIAHDLSGINRVCGNGTLDHCADKAANLFSEFKDRIASDTLGFCKAAEVSRTDLTHDGASSYWQKLVLGGTGLAIATYGIYRLTRGK